MAVNIIARQVGNDVIFSGSGSINTSQLTYDEFNPITSSSQFAGSSGDIYFGANTAQIYPWAASSPSSFNFAGFGGFGNYFADSSTGDDFAVLFEVVFLPFGYVSEQQLNFTMTFTGQSISSLQLNVGTYNSSWGTGATGDSIVFTIEPPPSPTPTPTKTSTPTPTPTNTQTPTVTPTKTSTPTPTPTNTQTPTVTSTNTPTPSITPSITPTNTRTPTPTPSITPSVTPTLTPSPTPFGVLDVNVQYDYTNEIFGSFSGGSWEAQYGNVPHPINYDPSRRLTVIDLSSITIGGQNGLNN